jgi:hypothetical protein
MPQLILGGHFNWQYVGSIITINVDWLADHYNLKLPVTVTVRGVAGDELLFLELTAQGASSNSRHYDQSDPANKRPLGIIITEKTLPVATRRSFRWSQLSFPSLP